ncbi:MAG: C-terminal binding protein [Candidatus Poribacteria bacterium]|nr:C-terminal binding protein [Candidatus Poribacteria bacterium]
MSNNWKVLITDYAWSSIEPEREVLAKIGAELIVAKTGDEEELLTLAPTVDGILTCWKPVRESVIDAAKKCQIIARYGIGLDNIDVETATENGIIVTNVPAYCVDEVSDHAMALLLACSRNISVYNEAIKSGIWDQNIGQQMYRLRGKTLGIIGFGHIAKAIIPKAKAFGLNVKIYSPRTSAELIQPQGAEKVSFQDLLKTADFITIHAPLTTETQHMFSHDEFRAMKSTAFLINTARGGIVDTAALTEALQNGEIAGAGIDVLETEPPEIDEVLLTLDNVVITPHAAFVSEESILELEVTAATCVTQVLTGQLPESIVNPSVLKRPNLRAKSLMQKNL